MGTLKKERVLITGGSGFLGINLARFLFNKGYQITILDIAPFDYSDIKDKVKVVIGDVRNKKDVASAMKDADYVIHTAAALPLYKEEDIISTEVEGTKNILLGAFKNKLKKVIHISSTAVYGVPNHHPIYETDKLQGVGPYGNAKIEAEAECQRWRQKGLCVTIFRPKSFVGPERLGVFALFYDWAYSGKNFPLMGNGKNRYQLLDVSDVCQAVYLALTLKKSQVNDTFNIGAEKFTTMKEDYQAVLDYAGHNKKIITFPATPVILFLRFLEFLHLSPLYKWVYETAATDSFVSIDKAKKNLGFKPKFSNKQALIKNYKWYVSNIDQFQGISGVSHRVPWRQGALTLVKLFF